MYVDLHINKQFSVKRGLNASGKSIDSDQPAQWTLFAIRQFSTYKRT